VLFTGCATTGLTEKNLQILEKTPTAKTQRVARNERVTLTLQKPIAKLSSAPAEKALECDVAYSSLQAKGIKITPCNHYQIIQSEEDLWERIRQGFAMPNLDTPLASRRTRWYAARPEYMDRMVKRSSKYLYYIVEALEKRNMPTELALLPFVESAFNPNAVSHAKAAGMWQFIPSTGRLYDLDQNAFHDDRHNVLASTDAALDYLQKLYAMFGDWHLALAAYNWGEGRVTRAIRRNKRAGKPTSYVNLRMPKETRNYVPKLQAIKNIVVKPQTYHIDLPFIPNRPYFEIVSIKQDIDIEKVIQLAEIPMEDFLALNPSFKRPVIFAETNPQILLPKEQAQIFKTNLANDQRPLATWMAWRAPKTMSTKQVATKVGIDEAKLRKINDIPPRMLIKRGSVLTVPRPKAHSTNVAASIIDNSRIRLQREVSYTRRTIYARKGDTVKRMAKRYGVSARSLAKLNRLYVNSKLKNGQSLIVYLPKGTKTQKGNSLYTRTTVKAKSRDTVATVAKRYGVSAKSLAKLNKLKVNTRLKPGTPLIIYLHKKVLRRLAQAAQ
jgi:membrane-bound lytic murein transglycosylase D